MTLILIIALIVYVAMGEPVLVVAALVGVSFFGGEVNVCLT